MNSFSKLFIFLFTLVFIKGDSMECTYAEVTVDFHDIIQENPFVITKDKVELITKKHGIGVYEFLRALVPIAKNYALPQISNYQVGIAGLGESGNIYLGVNLEFLGVPLNATVHGEQFLVVNARNHGERKLLAVALSAAPCGHCRQFLHEMGVTDNLTIRTPKSPDISLGELLPNRFGPHDLGIEAALMKPAFKCELIKEKASIEESAMFASHLSYAPYSNAKSGVAIKTKDGSIYIGSYLENAAFNPTLAPIQTALIALVANNRKYSDITHVVLAEKDPIRINQKPITQHILNKIAPEAALDFVEIND